jgi:hypothetical protein
VRIVTSDRYDSVGRNSTSDDDGRGDLRFGKPAIKGMSIEVRWEHREVGEDVDERADAFDLDAADVH